MFLFHRAYIFPTTLHKLDDQGNAQSDIQLTSLVRKNSSDFTFNDFIDKFIYTVVCLLKNNLEPRIGYDIQKTLHLSYQAKTRDWYLYQKYTEIKVYGFWMPPYKLPKYAPMRIFSLEYITQMINMDDFYFSLAKRKAQFKIQTQGGPFICNMRVVGTKEDTLFQQINFQLSFTSSYDPFSIMSSLRAEHKTSPYSHAPKPEIEKFMNRDQWEKSTLQEDEEMILSTTTTNT